MSRIVCPACARRTAEIITRDCPVCAGDGVLHLHPAAVGLYTVEVVAEAVRIALEAVARVIDDGTLLSAPQADLLADRVADLVTGRLIYFPEPASAAAEPVLAPVVPIRRPRRGKLAPAPDQPLLTEWLTPLELATVHGATPLDDTLIHAEPIAYGPEDRPLMRGLPVLSANGHPSSLARITDPVDQLVSTRTTVTSTKTRTRQATVLVTALPKAVKRRRRNAA
ncbi:hypothetical protein ACSYDW_07145 [Paeniglutamicibacter sp. R2-26]|uniref:hypothetical protein n=1 Tax=Paeniglutamicibacter sp. R2-26 TaxID=3144417 RepID=UPI003EE8171E